MKRVLIVDAPAMFREFLKDKFTEEKVEVTFVPDKGEAITKMISIMPDLVIFDISEYEDMELLKENLEKIHQDPNASRIPIIATGPLMDRPNLALFARLGIVKYFVKPIKFDVFFDSVGQILKTAFSMDTTPCVLDLHRNGNIIFIEIAQGLNREKLTLLKYRLNEMIISADLENPKVILMMTNLELTFIDGLNLELLLDNILDNPRVKTQSIKVLSFSQFTKNLIDGHPQYDGIEVTTDISNVLNEIVESPQSSMVSDLITDNLLTSTGEEEKKGSVEMRFFSDTAQSSAPASVQESNSSFPKPETAVIDRVVAVVDDDPVTQKLVAAGFISAGWKCDVYGSGTEFLSAVFQKNYSCVILDILMPGISGFDTLKRIQGMQNKPPIIIYSQAVNRELVIQALSLGAKQFLIKPQKPEVIVQKATDLINAGN